MPLIKPSNRSLGLILWHHTGMYEIGLVGRKEMTDFFSSIKIAKERGGITRRVSVYMMSCTAVPTT